MKIKTKKNKIQNECGMAMIETLPILIIFIVLFSYGVGFFGVVHTAIMNSMSARTYAFETFSNRSDVTLFRDRKADENGYTGYEKWGNRFHTVNPEATASAAGANLNGQYATPRNIAFGRRAPASKAKVVDHNTKIYEITGRNRQGGVEASPAWVMVGYGICLDLNCGDK